VTLTPQDVRDQRFKERFKGYDVEEVDAFLERVMEALGALHAERDALRERAEAGAEEPSELLARTLMTAQRAADETVESARSEAERILAEARSRAAQLLDEAQQRIEAERAVLDNESARVARAAESLVRFRTEYRTRVQAVIAEQLALLDRAGELPDVPQAVRDLATFGHEQIEAAEVAAAAPAEVAASALDETAASALQSLTDVPPAAAGDPAEAGAHAHVGEGSGGPA
jgi:DivIVA domain-containing protein